MPKLIPNAKVNIISTAKKQLFEKGYTGLNLREVADKCGLAVGTIYNYFSSKDMLVASIMAEDWLNFLKRMQKSCEAASAVEQGVRAIYNGIIEYVQTYEGIWTEYKGGIGGFGQRHVLLRSQLSELLANLLERLGRKEDTELCPLLSEAVLACAMHKDIDYLVLSKIINRIFNN